MIKKYTEYIKENNSFDNDMSKLSDILNKKYNIRIKTIRENSIYNILINNNQLIQISFIRNIYRLLIFSYEAQTDIPDIETLKILLFQYLDTMYYLDIDKFVFEISKDKHYHLYRLDPFNYIYDKEYNCISAFFEFLFKNNFILSVDELNKQIMNILKFNIKLLDSVSNIKHLLNKENLEYIEAFENAKNFDLI